MAYGVFGLVGFLAQMVVGMEGRLLPIFAWYWAYANTGYKGPVPSQHEMPWRTGRNSRSCCGCSACPRWRAALPSMPFRSSAPPHGALFAASLVDTVNVIRILRYAFLTPSSARL